MKKCHECDSELAGEESFCPICGILLTPVISAEPEPADELESTIMMPEEEIRRLAGGAGTAEAAVPAFAEDEVVSQFDPPASEFAAEPEPETIEEPEAEIESPALEETAAEANVESEMPEVPMPDILSDISGTASDPFSGVTSDNIPVKTSGGLSEEMRAEVEMAASAEIPEPDADLPSVEDERSEAETLSGPVDAAGNAATHEPAPPLDLATPDIEEEAIATLEENIPAFDPALTPAVGEYPEEAGAAESSLSETPEDLPLPEGQAEAAADPPPEVIAGPDDGETYASPLEERDEAPAAADQDEDEPPTMLWNDNSLGDIASQEEQQEEIPAEPNEAQDAAALPNDADADAFQIAIPDEELEQHDPFASGAMYDSVRIMEPDVFSALSESAGQAAGTESSQPSRTAGVSAGENAASQTANNIGENDTDGRRSAKLKPLPEGTVLNSRYEVLRKIGGGGMGAVYLASDNNLGGVLRAVKEMVQAHIEDEQQEKAINDFKRESTILSTLDHPSIPTIFDYFFDESEGRFYLVMKYISGGDLASRLRAAPEGRLDERTVTEWAIQIADVLEYLHNQPSPIVYRDLKPSNIMVDGNSGRVMLIDFGIARSISQREEKGVTAVGTMGYAPPELFSGNVEPRSDIYSLGSTMFHLLTGADPQSNPLLIFDFQKNPRPRQINPRLSDQIELILMRTVEYTADARFESASALKLTLSEHLAALDSLGVSYGVSEAPSSVSLANQTVFCGFCGQRIVATDLFCAFCGSKQPIAHEGVNSGTYSRAAMTAKLYVEGTGELSPPTFSLTKDENLVGRRDPMSNIFPEIDLSRFDPQTKISRRHARIWRSGSTFLVEDLGSSNGTVVASASRSSTHLVPHKPQALASGDRIKIGDTTLHFMIG